ncbi:MAG: hypothetical protein ABW252_10840 [Polyangiales bacterium]
MPYDEPEFRPDAPHSPPTTGPIGWEDPSRSWPRRLLATLGATFAPVETLLAVAGGEVRPALRFALVVTLPWMLLWAIIPFTHRLAFSPGFVLEVLPIKPGAPASVGLDVLRAAVIGFVLSLISLGALGLSFVSLLRAFADGSREEDPRTAGIRTMLYRAWVIPFALLGYFLVLWGQPHDPSPFVAEICWVGAHMLPRLLLLAHCLSMARYLGATGLGAAAVSMLPFVVEWAVQLTVQEGAVMLMPPPIPSPTEPG